MLVQAKQAQQLHGERSQRFSRFMPAFLNASPRRLLSFSTSPRRIIRRRSSTSSGSSALLSDTQVHDQNKAGACDSATSIPEPQISGPLIRHILGFPVSEHRLVTARGRVQTVRKQKNLCFIELVDGSTAEHLQVVAQPATCSDLETGCTVCVSGHLVPSRGSGQPTELRAAQLVVLGPCPATDYPLQKKSHSSAFLRTIPHLRLRTSASAALLRLRSAMSLHAALFFDQHSFVRTETPVLTFSDCEGAGDVFKVDADDNKRPGGAPAQEAFFGRQAFLTVSGQLHLEALSSSLGRVYCFGPAFRAERSHTSRHLAEFWMLEAELAFCEDLECLMRLVETLLQTLVTRLNEPDSLSAKDLQALDAPVEPRHAARGGWRRITYTEAVERIQMQRMAEPDSLPPVAWGEALESEHEKWLAGSFAQSPVFITHYPASLKPFYMRRSAAPGTGKMDSTVACFDLLVPGIGELAGGSLREPSLAVLRQNMRDKGIIPLNGADAGPAYEWYLDLRRYGAQPSAGFGIGWERLVGWVTGVRHVRECMGFPRTVGVAHC